MAALFRWRLPTLEEQVETLAECGIRMLPGVTVDTLLASWDRSDFENEPYLMPHRGAGRRSNLTIQWLR